MNKISDKIFSEMVKYGMELSKTESDMGKIVEKTIEKFEIEDDGTISFQLAYALTK